MPQIIGEGAFTYEIQLQWAKLPDSWILKDVADVEVDDANDRVYVFQRWKHPMLVFDREGNFIETWGSEIFPRAHGVTLGPDGHLYCVDDYGHNVRKCTVAGEVLQTWGTPDRSSGHYSGRPFNGPTKVAFDPKTNGFYVSDGYGNARVHKYSAEGDYLFSWGEPGQGPGQFNLAHSVNTDREGRVYVASREGTRLQVFDDEGNYLTEWRGPHKPNGVTISNSEPQLCYIGEASAAFPENKGVRGFGDCIAIFDLDGHCLIRLDHDSLPFKGTHGIAVDETGSIYCTMVTWGRGPWIDPGEMQLMFKLKKVG